ESMYLIDEYDRPRLGPASRDGQDIAQLGDVGHHGVHPHKPAAGFGRDRLRDAGLAATRRPIKHQTAKAIRRDKTGMQAAGLQNVILTYDFREMARTPARRVRLLLRGSFLRPSASVRLAWWCRWFVFGLV